MAAQAPRSHVRVRSSRRSPSSADIETRTSGNPGLLARRPPRRQVGRDDAAIDEGGLEVAAAAGVERLGARCGGHDVAAPAGKRGGQIIALPLLGVRDENRVPGPSVVDTGGQRQRERGSGVDGAVDGYLTAMVPNDSVADAEAKARPFADVAGREERIEDAGQVRAIDAMTGVLDEELDGAGLVVESRADLQALGGRPRIACSAFSTRFSSACCN